MFTDEAGGTRPVGRDRRGFLKELGLGGIARERRLSCRRLGTATFLSPAGSGDFLVAGWERRLSCRRLGAAAFLPPASVGEADNHLFSPVHSCHSVFSLSGFIHVH